MDTYKRMKTIELIWAQTEFEEEEIDKYDDLHLEAWAEELGFDWNEETQEYEEGE